MSNRDRQISLPSLAAGLTYDIDTSAAFPYMIDELRQIQTSSGTVTAAIKINGTAVTGMSSISVSSTPQDVTASGANYVKVGDQVQIVFSSNSGATNIKGTLGATANDISGGFINKFRNGTMDIWQRGTSGTVTTSGGYAADGWIAQSSGANATWTQTAGRASTAYALKITGATGVTDALVKQRIESLVAAPLYPNAAVQVTVQAKIYNNTGGSITPTITVKHANAADNWSATTTDVSAVSLQACPNGALTTVAYTFASASGTPNGLEVTIDFGNNFSTTGKSVEVSEFDIRVTPAAATGTNATPPNPELRSIPAELPYNQRYFQTSYDDLTPGTASSFAGSIAIQAPAATFFMNIPYKTTMRTDPTITLYSPNSGATGKIYDASALADIAASLDWVGKNNAQILTSAATANHTCFEHWAATAEL